MVDLDERWLPKPDWNGDGVLSFADLSVGFGYVFLAPGDLVIGVMVHFLPALARTLHYTLADYGGPTSAIISTVFWSFLLYRAIRRYARGR